MTMSTTEANDAKRQCEAALLTPTDLGAEASWRLPVL